MTSLFGCDLVLGIRTKISFIWNDINLTNSLYISGLLTVDPKQRLTMEEFRNNEWIKKASTSNCVTPLVTPDVLGHNVTSMFNVKTQLNVTMDAFHKAHREGFRLQDVTKAPLAQRRKMKRSSDARSSSSDSIGSLTPTRGSMTPTKGLTLSPMRNSPVRNLSNNSSVSYTSYASMTSTGFTPVCAANTSKNQSVLESSGYFSFKESRIAALMPTMPHTESEDAISDSNSRKGAKRKLELPDGDDDDCVIIGEEAPGSSTSQRTDGRTGSDVLNNNANNAKRPRSETIVIE